MEAIRSSESSVLRGSTRRNITEVGIFHRHRREYLKSYIASTGWALQRRLDLSPVRYEVGFYIPEDGFLKRHRCENLKSYTAIISLSTTGRYSVFREVRTSNLTQQSYPLAQLTDTVFSVRYESQMLHIVKIDYRLYNWNYTPYLKGYKVIEKLHLGVREQKGLMSVACRFGTAVRMTKRDSADATTYRYAVVVTVPGIGLNRGGDERK
jgi:hypothetical protein